MEIPEFVAQQAVKFLHRLKHELKNEPSVTATKIYNILVMMKSSEKQNSMVYQVSLRALETIVTYHQLNLDLMPLRDSLAAGVAVGDSASSQLADCREPRTSLDLHLATMKNHLRDIGTASGQELEKEYSVEVVSASADDKLDPFKFCRSSRSPPRQGVSPNEGRLDSSLLQSALKADSITNASAGCPKEGLAKLPPGKELPQNGVEVGLDPPNQSLQVDVNAVQSGLEIHSMKQIDFVVAPAEKEGTIKTSRWGHEITREDIEQHAGKKLEDVAKIFGVSRSTFKRICRKNNILRWPSYKREKVQHPHPLCRCVVDGKGHNAEDCRRDQPHSFSTQNKDTGSTAHPLPQKTTQYKSSMTVKATYGVDMIKFQLSHSSKMMDLVEEVTKRLKLPADNFKAKYLDEDNDFILLACDDDLEKCVSTMRSVGKTVVQIVIEPIMNQCS